MLALMLTLTGVPPGARRVPHLYQADASPPGGDTQYFDIQWPDDASINAFIATVVRISPPDPVLCERLTLGTDGWFDGGPGTINWTDEGRAPS